jgi:hypothetical protein
MLRELFDRRYSVEAAKERLGSVLLVGVDPYENNSP